MATIDSTAGRSAGARPAPRWFIANLARIHVTGSQTGGAYDVVELTGAPGDMPPLHVHHGVDEGFVVLEGELEVFTPEGATRVEAGATLLAPRDVPHTYRVVSDGPARWFAIASPGGFADFVEAVSEPALADELPRLTAPPDLERIAREAAAVGIELLGPPGALPTA